MKLVRPRFTLRALLLLVALASVGFALVATRLDHHRRQRRLAAELEASGATATLVNAAPGWFTRLPSGLQRISDEHTFAQVDNIDLVGVPLDERLLATLAACTELRYLDLSYSTITDEQLACLGTMQQLRVLNLANTKITDRSIHTLQACETLLDLDISGTAITAAAVANLQAALPHLDIDH